MQKKKIEWKTWTKPNTDTVGKYFVSKEGKPCFIYYDDLDADGWRMATWAMTIKERRIETMAEILQDY